MRIKHDSSQMIVNIISFVFVGCFAILCLVPFVIMVAGSFSDEVTITREGVGLYPKGFSTYSYELIFSTPRFLIGSYAVTIIMTVCGTLLGLFLVGMAGYALCRKDFKYRNIISFFIYFTTLFSAGIAPTYLWMVRYLQLRNNYLAVFLPLLMSPWLIFLMRNFMKGIPHEITESGKVDGAGDFKIFLHLILPMSTPALATIGLFLALGYWNEWYNSLLYISALEFKPLQYYLYGIVNTAAALRQSLAGANVMVGTLPSNTLKMATACVATGPIILAYPFVQKYFITGITIGAVKG